MPKNHLLFYYNCPGAVANDPVDVNMIPLRLVAASW